MATSAPLGEFEVVVLMAALHLENEAFPTTIREEIERRLGRALSRGSVYITLDRLGDKGLLTSKLVEPTAARGGHRRRQFKVTGAGIEAVRHTLATFARMQHGLEPLLGRLR